MLNFDEWLASYPVNVAGQNTKVLMRDAFNGALEACAGLADREAAANAGAGTIPRSGEASASLIAARIRSFKDKRKGVAA